MIWFIAAIVVLIIGSEIASYLVYRSHSFKDLKKFYDIIRRRKPVADDVKTFSIRYAEHPFLAVSLNPEFKNSFGEKIHNKYGFRCKDDFSNIDNKTVVYCAGGSSTYCNFIEKNEDTWPDALEGELKTSSGNNDIKVINAGCGGWTSYQSLIRFSAWVDILKPKLVVIYHCKNDFSPFINAKLSIREAHPDYGNIYYSLRLASIAKKLPFFTRFSYTARIACAAYVSQRYVNVLSSVYNLKRPLTREDATEGLKRVGEREYEFIISRYKSFAALCKYRGISVLFVTQKVVSDIFRPYIDELNRRIKLLENREDRCFVYDFANELSLPEGVLFDHVHFTEFGAKFFARHVKDYIAENIPLCEGVSSKKA